MKTKLTLTLTVPHLTLLVQIQTPTDFVIDLQVCTQQLDMISKPTNVC